MLQVVLGLGGGDTMDNQKGGGVYTCMFACGCASEEEEDEEEEEEEEEVMVFD
eukprot:m.28136 g.28136  ORF g.28136 m.28136 type:complete len:53 (+) comp10390_c0_seq1:77-235(+)